MTAFFSARLESSVLQRTPFFEKKKPANLFCPLTQLAKLERTFFPKNFDVIAPKGRESLGCRPLSTSDFFENSKSIGLFVHFNQHAAFLSNLVARISQIVAFIDRKASWPCRKTTNVFSRTSLGKLSFKENL